MDRIANLLTTLRNAGVVRKEKVVVPYSKYILSILEALKEGEYVKAVHADPENYSIEVVLNYDNEKKHKITEVKRISRPGRRVYYKITDINKIRNGFGNVILSTPKGIMTGRAARATNTGGEALFEIF
jgi:small subunit ribosomal protein S8